MSRHSTETPVRYKSLAFLGFPKYRVGTDGSVWSIHYGNWRKLKPNPHRNGYHMYTITQQSHRKGFYEHQLVLFAFIGPCPKGMECRHLDGNPGNNHLENLQWATHAQNMQDMKKHGTQNQTIVRRGEHNHSSKLTTIRVRKIRTLHATGKYTYRQLSEKFNISITHIYPVVQGKYWAHV